MTAKKRGRGKTPPFPEGAQTNEEEWQRFYDLFGHGRTRWTIRVLSKLPSPPRCEACGNPFGGAGGWLMRRMGKGPSRKNPRWCDICFEELPEKGGMTLTIGVLFADVRDSTAMAEGLHPQQMAERLNKFYADLTAVIVQHGIVDKLIGDSVMGLYFPNLAADGRYVDALVRDARSILHAVGYGAGKRPQLEVGIGLDVGPAYVGIVGEGEITDFTAIGDVVNTASRLQSEAGPGQIVMSETVATLANVKDGERLELDLKGKAEVVPARRVTV